MAVGTDGIAGHHLGADVDEQAQHAQPQVRELEDAALLLGAIGGTTALASAARTSGSGENSTPTATSSSTPAMTM